MLKPELKTVRLSEIIFDDVIYPRKDHDPVLVQCYADVLDEIEAAQKYISLSVDMKLLDGKHRWLAYRKRHENEDPEIKVLVYPVTTPHEQLRLAAKLNSDHGWQLTEDDKEATAKALYAYGATYDDIAATLSVGKVKVSQWLARTVKEQKDRRNKKIFDMWMACYTHKEISETVDITEEAVRQQISQIEFSETKLGKSKFVTANHLTDFTPPTYNIWKQQEKTAGSSHYGNSEVRWVDNLLYLYTDPFDVVIDPFAGGGSTIDICKKRFRRYWVSDRKPIVEREKEIRKWDVTEGLPPLHRWQDVKLVYLDPPYWKQAEGKYSNDPTDLANMELEEFNKILSGLINDFGKKLSNGYIALIIQPTQWNAPERRVIDHIADMLKTVRLPVDMRYSCPYESQQCNAQMVEWAKTNKRCLILTREIIVWRVLK